jgi:type I restriction-modification system DNA methylase subunit
MVNTDEEQFLNNLVKKLWTSADKLRSTLYASQYKHTVLVSSVGQLIDHAMTAIEQATPNSKAFSTNATPACKLTRPNWAS